MNDPLGLCEIFLADIKELRQLAKGGFGSIIVKLGNQTHVAKKFKDESVAKSTNERLKEFAKASGCSDEPQGEICQHFVSSSAFCSERNLIIQTPRGKPWPTFLQEDSATESVLCESLRHIWKAMKYLLFDRGILLTDFKADNTIWANGRIVLIDLDSFIVFDERGWDTKAKNAETLIQTWFIGLPLTCFPDILSQNACQIWGILLTLQCLALYEVKFKNVDAEERMLLPPGPTRAWYECRRSHIWARSGVDVALALVTKFEEERLMPVDRARLTKMFQNTSFSDDVPGMVGSLKRKIKDAQKEIAKMNEAIRSAESLRENESLSKLPMCHAAWTSLLRLQFSEVSENAAQTHLLWEVSNVPDTAKTAADIQADLEQSLVAILSHSREESNAPVSFFSATSTSSMSQPR
jgi:hypothetical protein